MQRLGRVGILILIWGFVITCARITVNIYFPAAEIQNAASKIEKEVRQEKTTPDAPMPTQPTPQQPPSSQSWSSHRYVYLRFNVPEARAQTIDINITTPAIRRLIESRKRRFPLLIPLFNAGALGENNQGLLDLRSLQQLSLQDKARAKTLQQQENHDRQQLYQELGKANQIAADRINDIANIFAEVNRKEARSGWWIQEQSGNWKKK